jgi:YVTN family beta-propeller protein
MECVRGQITLIPLVLLFVGLAGRAAQPEPAFRQPQEDVNSPAVRQRPNLAPDRNLLFNGWGVTPVGDAVPVSDMPLRLVIAPDRQAVVAVCGGYNNVGVNLISLDGARAVQFIPLKEAFTGLAFNRAGTQFYVTGGDTGLVYVFDYAQGKARLAKEVKPNPEETMVFLAGLAVHPETGALYVCNEANHEVWVLSSETLLVEKVIGVGQHPHSCAFGGDHQYLYVSNWGSRSVSIIDAKRHRRVRDLTVGLRPNDLVLAPEGRLFVACAGDNTVHVITTAKLEPPGVEPGPTQRLWEGTREIISTSLYPQSPEGSTPCGLAVSPDGRTLFVANADNNAVMVVDISGALLEEAKARGDSISLVNGFIPAGWYPSAVAVTPDNQYLLVANGKGLASRSNVPAKSGAPSKTHTGIMYDHPGRVFQGALSFVPRPTAATMAAHTDQVRRNSPFHPDQLRHAPLASASVIPAKVGEPCPIKYVVYVIKENRTYDQVFGDMKDAKGRPIGNGDPTLTLYGEAVTPNHHQLARDYVLLDNLYCNGEVSVDGHSWCDAAMATDFNQRSWIISYSKHGKLPGNEEMERPANGYLWDLCRRHGVSFKNYGEGAQRVPTAHRGKWTGARDTQRVNCWIRDLKRAERDGDLPRFTIMSLGEDHTKGTTVGANTPEACVGSNDLALGRLVEAATHSRFWKQMAIFVIEDDAQNGPDHVDAHRTVGLVLSPWCKRQFVDSTLYTTASMVRTMELILGLPPLTQYDAGATPMFHCFRRQASFSPYTALVPRVNLEAKNTAKSMFAKESSRMNFRGYDLAPEDELNRILWHVAKPGVPYPPPIHRALFTQPLASAGD